MQTRFRRRLSASLSCALVVAAVCAGMARAETLIVERPMPAPMVEHAPPPPSAGYNWVPGHWVWRGFEWTWAPGHYVPAAVAPMPAVIVETRPPRPSPEHVWVQGHWGWHDERHGWSWNPGMWFHH